MTRRPLRVRHTAGLHLDSDGYGADVHRERERLVFQRIVDRVLAGRVDLLLIAGDFFDHNRASDETVAFVRRELEVPVVASASAEASQHGRPEGSSVGCSTVASVSSWCHSVCDSIVRPSRDIVLGDG